jgi:beta-phosphoglucomutase
MTRNIKAIIFDMDGVLVDSEPVHIQAWQQVLKGMGHGLPEEWFFVYIGVGDVEVSSMIVERLKLDSPADEFLELKCRVFDELGPAGINLFPGVAEGVGRLRSKGLRTALCTGSRRKVMDQVLEKTGLTDYFEFKLSADDCERHKPNPDPYLKLMEKMDLQPDACLIIEDSENGLRAARASGARVVAVQSMNDFDHDPYAERIFEQTGDAIDWILSLM